MNIVFVIIAKQKKRWREAGNLDELSSVFEVIGWLKLPPSKDIIEKN